MRYDFAPMEGVTDRVYREAFAERFGGVDRYYLPFFSPTHDHLFPPRDARELAPEPNFCVVPQLLSRNPEDCLWALRALAEMGYGEVNLNLGCPSGTVTAKGKGSGFLREPAEMWRFFDAVFDGVPRGLRVSVKTRIGYEDPSEWEVLLPVFASYPFSEMIVHPRTRRELYSGEIHEEAYSLAGRICPFPVTYNGDLFGVTRIVAFTERNPDADRVMVGRGFVIDPTLILRLSAPVSDSERRRRIAEFDAALAEGYLRKLGWEGGVLSRKKELWNYMVRAFDDTSGKYRKALGKARDLSVFDGAVSAILSDLPFAEP